MRAVRCSEGVASLVDVPEAHGDGIVVRVASAGICGSDLHLESWNLPATLGHELAGFLPDGTAVAVEPMAPCGVCPECRSGAYNLCASGPSMMIGVGRDGGMAEECLVPPSAIVPLPGGVAVGDACLVEPLAVAVHAVRRGQIKAGERVAVVGGGTIGQTAVVAAQEVGAAVDLEARHDHQRAVANQLGAGEVGEEASRYDVVLESAGTGSALERSIALCRPGGRVVLLGTYWDAVTMPGLQMGMAEITLVPASMYGRAGAVRDIDVAAALLATRPELAQLIITHRFPLDGVREAFATARDRASGAIKVVLEP
jgi:threonine dehydrogenase-like Zn-dependent dehydrogenase